ncbi:MAG TPA: MFS transporter [Streptosporangiaceae bacterium]
MDRRWLLRLALVLAVFVNNANFSATTVALPSIQHSLGLGFSGLQWTMTSYLLTYSACMLPGGRLSDVIGIRPVLLGGIAVYLAAMLIVASAASLPVLLAGRGLQGVAAAMITPTTTSAARTRFSGAAQTATIGLIVGMSAIGQAIGPLLGGALDQGIGWRAVFIVNVPLLAMAAVLTLATMPPGHRPAGPAGIDAAGAAMFAVALALLTIALTASENYGAGNLAVVGGLAAAVGVLAAFFVHVSRRPDALVDAGLLRSRTFAVTTAVGFTMTFTLASVLFFEALYLERVRGYGTLSTGLLFLPMTALFGVLSTQAARIERRFGRRLPAVSGLATACAGCLVLALGPSSAPATAPPAGLFLIGLGLGVSWAQVTSIGLRAAPANQAGQAAGVLFTARWVGGTLGIAVLGLVYRWAADAELAARLSGPSRALSHGTADQLDGLLSGSAHAGAVLARLRAQARMVAATAVRDAAGRGTGWALAGVAVVAGLGAALCLLVPRDRSHDMVGR